MIMVPIGNGDHLPLSHHCTLSVPARSSINLSVRITFLTVQAYSLRCPVDNEMETQPPADLPSSVSPPSTDNPPALKYKAPGDAFENASFDLRDFP